MIDYENVLEESDRQRRIEIVLADAYGEYERMSAFLCYLDEYLSFPFRGKIRNEPRSPEFNVLGFSSLEPNRIVCKIKTDGGVLRTPLSEVEPTDDTGKNSLIIGDLIAFLGIE